MQTCILLAALLLPCQSPNTGDTQTPDKPKTERPVDKPKTEGSVVVYCSVDTAFAKPILKTFEERTGIKVHYVGDTEAGKTTGLVNKLLAEKDAARADVWWSGEIFGTMQLAAGGVLAPYKPASAEDIPTQYRDPAGLWTAFGLRGRVIAYDPNRTKKEDLPQRWSDLALPKYKGRFAMADPRFGTTRGHMAALFDLWGEDRMRSFYESLRANDYRRADGNSHAVLLLSRGVVEFAATDTDDVIVAKARGDSIDVVYPSLDLPDGEAEASDAQAGDAHKVGGTLWIPCSVAMTRDAPHPLAAKQLIEYLASAEIEVKLYQSESRNVPVRPALREKLNAEVPAEAVVDYAAAARAMERSDKLVRETLLR